MRLVHLFIWRRTFPFNLVQLALPVILTFHWIQFIYSYYFLCIDLSNENRTLILCGSVIIRLSICIYLLVRRKRNRLSKKKINHIMCLCNRLWSIDNRIEYWFTSPKAYSFSGVNVKSLAIFKHSINLSRQHKPAYEVQWISTIHFIWLICNNIFHAQRRAKGEEPMPSFLLFTIIFVLVFSKKKPFFFDWKKLFCPPKQNLTDDSVTLKILMAKQFLFYMGWILNTS